MLYAPNLLKFPVYNNAEAYSLGFFTEIITLFIGDPQTISIAFLFWNLYIFNDFITLDRISCTILN